MSVLELPTMNEVAPPRGAIRLGVVAFLNAKPLVHGLAKVKGLSIRSAPPSELIDLLTRDEVDLALCSSIDLLTAPFEVSWLGSTPLACDGSTHTVRLFSHRPIDQVSRIHCDGDSHTSIALLRVLLAEYWQHEPELVSLDSGGEIESMLLIGDKVVGPDLGIDQWPVQVDLGDVWKQHTGLPFVFAVWMGRASNADIVQRAGRMIDRQYRLNRHRLHAVIENAAADLGWDPAEAMTYLTQHIRFDFSEREHEGLRTFLNRCVSHGIVTDCCVSHQLSC
ncbi:MAG: menaquinone biosynthesis protein [Phycisphaerales bacterium]|jgi:chorismate dehydratase|nr:menaquinone biosynthesis protein [Phycisphaerales bacterium]